MERSIILKKMSKDEYLEFYKISFESHVEELMLKEALSQEAAEDETKDELKEMLPDGLETKNSFLFSIKLQDHIVGYIWFLIEYHEKVKQAFICDFMIYKEYRNKGYGQLALSKMEKVAHDYCCKESVLFVEENNMIAQKLYEKTGYEVIDKHNDGFFMKKNLNEYS